MRYAARTWRLGRLLVFAVGMALAGCGSQGVGGDVDSSLSYRKVVRYDRSASKGREVVGPRFASLTFGEHLRVPQMRVIHVDPSRPAAFRRSFKGAAQLQPPVSGAEVTSYFGMREHPVLGGERMHEGIDLGAPSGTPIRAAADGVVDFANWNGGYGRFVVLQHGKRYSTAYAHMSRFAEGIEPGTTVHRGDVIGYVGSTGRTTGPHLHFELRDNDQPVDPLEIMPLETVVAIASR